MYHVDCITTAQSASSSQSLSCTSSSSSSYMDSASCLLVEALICLLFLFKSKEFFCWCRTRERNILQRGLVVAHIECDKIGDGCCTFDVCRETVLSISAFKECVHGPLRLCNADLSACKYCPVEFLMEDFVLGRLISLVDLSICALIMQNNIWWRHEARDVFWLVASFLGTIAVVLNVNFLFSTLSSRLTSLPAWAMALAARVVFSKSAYIKSWWLHWLLFFRPLPMGVMCCILQGFPLWLACTLGTLQAASLCPGIRHY